MSALPLLMFNASTLGPSSSAPVPAQHAQRPYVRLAELVVDPARLDNFNAALREGIATAVLAEPGVLALYAVHEEDDPTHIRVFEVYTDVNAYKAHLETPHFRRFRDITDTMVTARKLAGAVPVMLATKPR